MEHETRDWKLCVHRPDLWTVASERWQSFLVTSPPRAVCLGLFTRAGRGPKEGASHLVLDSLNLLANILGANWGKDNQESWHLECRPSLKSPDFGAASLRFIARGCKEWTKGPGSLLFTQTFNETSYFWSHFYLHPQRYLVPAIPEPLFIVLCNWLSWVC